MAKMEKRRVMIAVDDTEVSANAFSWAVQNLVREEDHVIILTAAPYIGPNFPTADMTSEYGIPILPSPEESEIAERKITRYSKIFVNNYLQQLSKLNISCDGEVVKGDAGCWIVDEGGRVRADIIVVGSNAYGLVKRTILGSISDYVLHNAPCPVAIVRHLEEELQVNDAHATSTKEQEDVTISSTSTKDRKVVIAVDESKEAIYAFTWALVNFCKPSDIVIIYHVHQPHSLPFSGVGTGDLGIEEVYIPLETGIKDEVASLKESQKIVEKFMAYADHKSEISCKGIVVTGQTEAKVIEGLIALKADVVVVGSHERGVVARTFLGSVSDHLAHNSPCPLIVVKAGYTTTKSIPEAPSNPQHTA